jgi:hypothetical protein
VFPEHDGVADALHAFAGDVMQPACPPATWQISPSGAQSVVAMYPTHVVATVPWQESAVVEGSQRVAFAGMHSTPWETTLAHWQFVEPAPQPISEQAWLVG